MKISAISILAIIALIACTLSAKAQKSDYVINNNNDTIKSEVRTPFMGKVKYKPNGGSDFIKVSIDSIKEYHIERKKTTFRRVYFDSTGFGRHIQYLEVIERGPISLYQQVNTITYANGTSTSTTEWYAAKNSDTVTYLKTSSLGIIGKSRAKRKEALAAMLKDKQEIHDKFIKDDKFGFEDIQNIVHWYNTGKQFEREQEKVDISNDFNPNHN